MPGFFYSMYNFLYPQNLDLSLMQCINCPFWGTTLPADSRQDVCQRINPKFYSLPFPDSTYCNTHTPWAHQHHLPTDLLVLLRHFMTRVLSFQVVDSWLLQDLWDTRNLLWENNTFSVKSERMILWGFFHKVLNY